MTPFVRTIRPELTDSERPRPTRQFIRRGGRSPMLAVSNTLVPEP